MNTLKLLLLSALLFTGSLSPVHAESAEWQTVSTPLQEKGEFMIPSSWETHEISALMEYLSGRSYENDVAQRWFSKGEFGTAPAEGMMLFVTSNIDSSSNLEALAPTLKGYSFGAEIQYLGKYFQERTHVNGVEALHIKALKDDEGDRTIYDYYLMVIDGKAFEFCYFYDVSLETETLEIIKDSLRSFSPGN